MRTYQMIVALGIAAVILGAGLQLAPYVFDGRIPPGVTLGGQSLAGIPQSTVADVVVRYEQELRQQPVEVVLREKKVARPLGVLGVSLHREATLAAIMTASTRGLVLRPQAIVPKFVLNQSDIMTFTQQEFATLITVPQNATFIVSPARTLVPTASATGEAVDLTTFGEDIKWRARHNDWQVPIELVVVSSPASVHEGEVTAARDLAQALLQHGLPISDGTTTWTIAPFTVARLLRFVPVADPGKAGNEILGVTVDVGETQNYLTTTIAPEINQPAIDARFERVDNQVTQFAVPQAGKALNIEQSTASIQTALLAQQRLAQVVVDTTEPAIQDTSDTDALGITELLATGESDFVGSPANRIHNILEGIKRYHGLLISPGQDFSFNEFLGPVDGQHGFKPELVIKKNVTIPEFGGGLCQVSTTLFRSAVQAGLKITQRRNHAYAVRYYGTPGFDATIYPPYTDLRFTNNTPGYILIQTRVEGTKLAFDLWGTNDTREVSVDGPITYGRTANGAVKATLTQKVTRNGELIIDDTFYSRYQSPNLFPKQPLHANTQSTSPAAPTPTPTTPKT